MTILLRILEVDRHFDFELESGFIAAGKTISGLIKCTSQEATLILEEKKSALLLVEIERNESSVISSLRIDRANQVANGLSVDLVSLKVA
jgi:hypothetical protein